MKIRSLCVAATALVLLPAMTVWAAIDVVDKLDASGGNDYYVGNREPLVPSPLIKLPIKAIRPEGWVRRQLELQAAGFVGNLTEISRFLKKQDNAWLSPAGRGHSPWEELPYWLKGFGDTGYVLENEKIISEASTWIEAVLASQRKDGYFGPRDNLSRINGKPDVWPNMIMLNALQSYYEYSGDKRVLDFMTKYFKWQLTVPDEDFLEPFWQNQRAGDNLASIYWLYNRTGDKELLQVAEKVHRNTANWTEGVANWHGVNITQCFREPGIYFQQSGKLAHIDAVERNYQTVMGIYGQVPGGMFGADENCRKGYTGPRQAAETCSMVEYMLSFEMLLGITGDLKWADRCEEVAFNSLPASMTADLKALHYLTAPNMILCDRHSKAPGLQNGGPMLLFNPHIHRCCQHNVAHGWPYYAERLWFATPGNGLAVAFYAPSTVTAKVGDGKKVTIKETTRYPFQDRIHFEIKATDPVEFPLFLRIPGWCTAPKLSINGKEQTFVPVPRSYIRIVRKWTNKDTIELSLPMKVALRTWAENKNSISIDRGPLTYSLKIGEKHVRVGGTDKWPAIEIHPTGPWNYGLILEGPDPAASFKPQFEPWPDDDQPFTPESVPVSLKAKACRIPGWTKDHLGLVGKLQDSPAASDEPVETVTLIPMGAARLRISAFPTIGAGPDAHKWQAPPKPIPASASHCWGGDTLSALSDTVVPESSADRSLPRFTWWDHKGTVEWVQYDFEKARAIGSVSVYWFDDTGRGHCRVPQSWRLLYKDGDEFVPVKGVSDYGVQKDRFNSVTFKPVKTTALRIEAELQQNFSAGILEWRVDKPSR